MSVDAKTEYLAKLKERLTRTADDDPVRQMFVSVALEAADGAWDAAERVNYARGVVDGQTNAFAVQEMAFKALGL